MPKKQQIPKPASQPTAPTSNASVGSVNDARMAFQALSSLLGTRAGVAAYLGKSFAGKRDLYDALGYTKIPTFADFMGKYRRQDLAKAIVDIPVRASWRKPPQISEVEDEETIFEKRWVDIAERLNIWSYFSRTDRLASIGEYAVLLIGFNDAAQMWQPVKSATDVLYVMPYSQQSASISTYVTDTKDPRYSLPLEYTIQMRTAQGSQATTSRKVHWSRIIHVSEDNLEDDILGLPRLEATLNRLENLELVAGGSAEMFWRGAFPGFGLKADPDYQFTTQSLTDIQDEAEKYVHNLQRYMRLSGVSVESLAQQVADPEHHADILITLIAAVCRIPKRILLGSELGELASSQDEANWYARVDERRELHCEPTILRAFIDRLIDKGVLPKPTDRYTCKWPTLLKQSDKEKAEVAKIKTEAIGTYVSTGAAMLLPPEFYLENVLGYSRDEIDKINDMADAEDLDADGDGNEPPPQPDDPDPGNPPGDGNGGGSDE